MSSSNFFKSADPRHTDIAARKSTPNALDDSVGQGLGEVNQLLERRFAEPVAPPERLSFAAVTELIHAQPETPYAPVPWYRYLHQPGHLAVAGASAALVYVLLAVMPITTQTSQGLEARVYAQGLPGELTKLPPPSALAPDGARPDVQWVTGTPDAKTPKRHEIQVEVRVEHGPNGTTVHQFREDSQQVTRYATLRLDGGSRTIVDSQIADLQRDLEAQGMTEVDLRSTIRDVEIEQQFTIIELIGSKYRSRSFSGRVVDVSPIEFHETELSIDELIRRALEQERAPTLDGEQTGP